MNIALDAILNRANAGVRLASEILDALHSGQPVRLDFSNVDRMTPSFANALVMTLMHSPDWEHLKSRMVMEERNEQVISAMDESEAGFKRDCGLASSIPHLPETRECSPYSVHPILGSKGPSCRSN